jgi:hypothetical protein
LPLLGSRPPLALARDDREAAHALGAQDRVRHEDHAGRDERAHLRAERHDRNGDDGGLDAVRVLEHAEVGIEDQRAREHQRERVRQLAGVELRRERRAGVGPPPGPSGVAPVFGASNPHAAVRIHDSASPDRMAP